MATPLLVVLAFGLARLEVRRPLRARTVGRRVRWPRNVAWALVSSPLERLAVARVLASSPRGVIARLPVPAPVRVVLGVAALDASMWLWHRANHQIASLWRFHRAHHLDPDVDVTTAVRFHPMELALSLGFRWIQQRTLGPGPAIAILHETCTLAAALFHHSNMELGAELDGALSRVLVTPRMHGVHHARDRALLASNWGVILSIWDRLAGTQRCLRDARAIAIGVPDA